MWHWPYSFNNQNRVFIPIQLNEYNDEAFQHYTKMLSNLIWDYDEMEALTDYNVWQSGYFRGNKLFKYLRKNYLGDNELAELTTLRTNSNLFLCISNNPLDWLFISTNQSFTSCMDLNSDYSDAFYFGTPEYLINPHTLLVFLTNGKLRNFMIKGIPFKHFRYINRTIAFITSDSGLALSRYYPGESISYGGILRDRMGMKVYEPYSDEYWISDPISFDFLAFKNGELCEPYNDSGRCSNHNYDTFYSNLRGPAGSRMNLYWCHGFEEATSLTDICRQRYCCICCDDYYEENDVTWINDEPICWDCANERTYTCDECDDRVWDDEINHTDYEDVHLCNSCWADLATTCTRCDCYVLESNMCEFTDDDIVVCPTCARNIGYNCNSCAEWHLQSPPDQERSQLSKITNLCHECLVVLVHEFVRIDRDIKETA